MARIILGSYAVRFPLGGYLSWVLQSLLGFQRLGHDIYFVEKAGWQGSCFDPVKNISSNDCSFGTKTLNDLLARFGLEDNWCFVDIEDSYYGLSRNRIEDVFKSADIFIDMGTHGAWRAEAEAAQLRVLIECEPAATQMKMETDPAFRKMLAAYDFYYTVGRNIGTDKTTAPTAGKQWRTIATAVNLDLYPSYLPDRDAPFTTVMSWQAHKEIEFDGKTFGQKDIEFSKFIDLPRLTKTPLEIAVTGKNIPIEQLKDAGWRIRNAHQVSATFDSYNEYIGASKGEFSVCKNVFAATNSGWFSDRSAVYLARGRPVVLQETGFSEHLPCGLGLFAVRTPEEAAAALYEINSDYVRHSESAREIAAEYLDARKVFTKFLQELGISD